MSAKHGEGTVPLRVIWTAALVPFVLLGYLLHAHRVPPELEPFTMRLSGAWKIHPGGEDGLELREVVDDAWAPFELPGDYQRAGYVNPRCWLRRHFLLPSALQGRSLLLTLNETQTGAAEVFVNGKHVGNTEVRARGSKVELAGMDAWRVPAELLRPGDNVVALRMTWGFIGESGLYDSAVYLGDHERLQPFFQQSGDIRRFFQQGAIFLAAFLAVLFCFLLVAEWQTQARERYVAGGLLLLGAFGFLAVGSGFFGLTQNGRAYATLLRVMVHLVLLGGSEFLAVYYRAGGLMRRVNRWATVVFVAVSVLTIPFGIVVPLSKPLAYTYFAAALGWMTLLTVQRLVRGADPFAPMVASAFLCAVAASVYDLARQTGLAHGPRMFPLGMAFLALTQGVVLVANFVLIAFMNRELSASLQTKNAELQQALAKAQEASRLKSEFVANISHELRTPLNSLLNVPEGLLELFPDLPHATCRTCKRVFEIETGEKVDATTACPGCGDLGTLVAETGSQFTGDAETARRSLQQIQRCGESLGRLIDDMLDFSKLESGKISLEPAALKLRSELAGLLLTLAPWADETKHRLVLELGEADPTVWADRTKLAQVFTQLLENAVKFSPEGSTVRVRIEERPESCRVGVEDRGIGIAPENQQLIFESFRQVDGGNTRRFGGTGLGLAICRRLVEAHGGTLQVESALGQGSKFFVELPLAPRPAHAFAPDTRATPRARA